MGKLTVPFLVKTPSILRLGYIRFKIRLVDGLERFKIRPLLLSAEKKRYGPRALVGRIGRAN